MTRFVLPVLPLLVLLLLGGCNTPTQTRLDTEVDRLCAIDGGVKVYETVMTPPERFNKYGQIDFYRPTQGENALGPDYLFRFQTTYYREGNPRMSRMHFQVIRRADQKLLGESVLYSRVGGDVPAPMHDSRYVCPSSASANEMALFRTIFIPLK
jgi:hypothetical protein